MSMPEMDTNELHNCIIDYLTKWSRIMTAQDINTWNDFVAFSSFKYLDYSREDLRAEFFQVILPKVFTYDLTPLQKRKIEIFANHHKFERTDTGFVEIEATIPPPIEGVDYVTLENADKFPNIACVLIPLEKSFQGCPPDLDVLTWISAVHSTDEELTQFTLLEPEEIRKRALKATKDYEETGQLPENLDSQVLCEKLEKYINATKRLCSTLEVMEE